MKLHRTFQFRIYPTPEQEARLRQWEGALRFLWNLALTQYEMGMARPKGERVYPSAVRQQRELTALRAEVDWLEDVPRAAEAEVLNDLGVAWQRCFDGLASAPRFKMKRGDAMSIFEGNAKKSFRLDRIDGRDVLVFPKLGAIDLVLHRPAEGKPCTCTLVRDVDQWFVNIVCEQEVPEPAPPPGPVVGVDRGVANVVADSQGRREPRPAFLDKGQKKIAKLQRQADKKKRGSKNQKKANRKVARAQRKVRRQREHLAHTLAYAYASQHSVIVIEALNLTNMTRSAKGTTEEPGINVAQKAGLNRAILGSGLGKFGRLVKQKSVRFGSLVVEVEAAYTSQTCAECGHVDAASRKSQSEFCCTKCGHRDHADVNAAKVLVQRYQEMISRRTGGGEVCGGDGVTRPVKQKRRDAKQRRATTSTRKPKGSAGQGGDGLRARLSSLFYPALRARTGGLLCPGRGPCRRRCLKGPLGGSGHRAAHGYEEAHLRNRRDQAPARRRPGRPPPRQGHRRLPLRSRHRQAPDREA